MVLDHGRIVERGTHGELLEQNGVHARLVRSQTDAGGGWPVSRPVAAKNQGVREAV